jgi:small neutral amino acid transporter SnatA (MarC family)
MDQSNTVSPASGQTKNPLSYALIALGALLLVVGIPVLFATSQVSRLIGDTLGQTATMVVLGLLIVVSGATMVAIGLRKR